MVIYVGDGAEIINRIKSNHCGGNVEGSALRRFVANAKGFHLRSERRPSGSVRVRIDSTDPRRDERIVSEYIRAGNWRLVQCSSADEARDFQWYVIERVRPLCNVTTNAWNPQQTIHYASLLRRLLEDPPLTFAEVRTSRLRAPGVYVFEHPCRPDV